MVTKATDQVETPLIEKGGIRRDDEHLKEKMEKGGKTESAQRGRGNIKFTEKGVSRDGVGIHIIVSGVTDGPFLIDRTKGKEWFKKS